MNRILLLVGLGGFIGSVVRYYAHQFALKYFPSLFPYGTFAVNVIGCFLIGIIYGLTDRGNILTPEWRLFLATGFCGGFTTFSAFSLESINLIREGQLLTLFVYVAASVIIGIAATYFGMLVIKSI